MMQRCNELVGRPTCRIGRAALNNSHRPIAIQIANPLVNVDIHGPVRPGQVAGIEKALPHGFQVFGPDAIGEDRPQVFVAEM